MEQTLSIIKPDAVAKNVVGNLRQIESAGLRIAATKYYNFKADAEHLCCSCK